MILYVIPTTARKLRNSSYEHYTKYKLNNLLPDSITSCHHVRVITSATFGSGNVFDTIRLGISRITQKLTTGFL